MLFGVYLCIFKFEVVAHVLYMVSEGRKMLRKISDHVGSVGIEVAAYVLYMILEGLKMLRKIPDHVQSAANSVNFYKFR